jgi:predicted RNase H-like HicB family nuclease
MKRLLPKFPNLRVVLADGETHRQALANAKVIIEEWIETAKDLGRKIPEPKGRLVFA